MALSQKSRSDEYEGLRSIMNDQSAEDLLAHFPARDLDEPVTREVLHAEIAGVRTEMAAHRTDLTLKITELDTRLTDRIADLDTRLTERIADVRTELASLETRLTDKIFARTNRNTGLILAAIGAATALLRLT
jgi:hypothetical protein